LLIVVIEGPLCGHECGDRSDRCVVRTGRPADRWPGVAALANRARRWGSAQGSGHGDLGAAVTGMTGHDPMGEEAAAVRVVLAGTGPPGRFLGAVRDSAVAVHDQLSGTAPHPSPPSPSWPAWCRRWTFGLRAGGGPWRSIGASGRLLEEKSQHFPNFPAVFSGSPVTVGGERTRGRAGRSSPPPR
jgi:hypothetical protein